MNGRGDWIKLTDLQKQTEKGFIFGGLGGDSSWGEEGDDELEGGLGNDRMFGGPGDDVVIVANFANEWQMTSADMAEAVEALRS